MKEIVVLVPDKHIHRVINILADYATDLQMRSLPEGVHLHEAQPEPPAAALPPPPKKKKQGSPVNRGSQAFVRKYLAESWPQPKTFAEIKAAGRAAGIPDVTSAVYGMTKTELTKEIRDNTSYYTLQRST